MAKNLRIQDRLLLGLALMGETVVDTVGGASYARRAGTLNFWSPPGYQSKNFYAAVWRMLKTGSIEKVVKDGRPYLRLANKGEKRLARDFPLLRWQNKRWDGKWRIVIFDIEEKNRKSRDALRWKLLDLGFGQLQKSIYISPHNVGEDTKEFLESRNYLSDEVLVLEAKQMFVSDPKEIAERVWKVSQLENSYLTIEAKTDNLFDKDTSSREEIVKELYDEYLGIILDDPFLPLELLPTDWPADRIRRKLLKLSSRS